MSVILDFNEEEKKNFISKLNGSKRINYGAESICLLSGGYVYKIYNNLDEYHNINNTICKDDLDLESFVFPEEIYTCNGKVFASKSRYIDINILDLDTILYMSSSDIKNIKKALPSFIKDIYTLSKNDIEMYDAVTNIMFTGKKFYAIDTLSYKHKKNTYKTNINLLKTSVDTIFDVFESFLIDMGEDEFEYFDDIMLRQTILNTKLNDYIDYLAKKTEEEFKDKEIQKIKRSK